jgi:hypothetical protein
MGSAQSAFNSLGDAVETGFDDINKAVGYLNPVMDIAQAVDPGDFGSINHFASGTVTRLQPSPSLNMTGQASRGLSLNLSGSAVAIPGRTA